MILGAVLAGGLSQRFGRDKALVEVEGQTLLARSVDRLAGWCEQVVVVGRAEAPAPTLPDWPRGGMGPLGGLAAALRHAADADFSLVLTIPVDSPSLPEDLLARLSPAPAFLRDQPVIGLWPVSATAAVEEILREDTRHAMRTLTDRIGARSVELDGPLANINTPEDWQAFVGRAD